MTPGDDEPQRLGDVWDALLNGDTEPLPESTVDPTMLSIIHELYAMDEAPAPDPALQTTIWRDLTGEVLSIVNFAPLPITLPSSNGKVSHPLAQPVHPIVSRSNWTKHRAHIFVLGLIRLLAIGAIAGFGAGFISGIGARLAMRIAGFLTIDRNRGLLTENDSVVGLMTVGGTLSIAMFGAMMGVLGGLIFLSVRSRLPGTGWRRGLIFGGLLLAVFGFFVMDKNNPDYRRFGPPAVNVITFSLVYVLFGLLAALFADLLDRLVPRWSFSGPVGVRTRLLYVAMMPVALVGLLAVISAVIIGVSSFFIFALFAGLASFIWWVGCRRLQSRWWVQPAFAGYLVVGASCFVGFFLTARGIAGILGVG